MHVGVGDWVDIVSDSHTFKTSIIEILENIPRTKSARWSLPVQGCALPRSE